MRKAETQILCTWVSEWVKSLSRVWLFVTPWTVAHQALPSMGFSRQEYWHGLPFSSPGDLPDPGIEPRSHALQADALTSEPSGKPNQVAFKKKSNHFIFPFWWVQDVLAIIWLYWLAWKPSKAIVLFWIILDNKLILVVELLGLCLCVSVES